MMSSPFVLIRSDKANPAIESPFHVVNGRRWLETGDVPRTRCQKRVGPRWRVVAATSRPSQIVATDACPACLRTFFGKALSSVNPPNTRSTT